MAVIVFRLSAKSGHHEENMLTASSYFLIAHAQANVMYDFFIAELMRIPLPKIKQDVIHAAFSDEDLSPCGLALCQPCDCR